jgi:hypothetical protein
MDMGVSTFGSLDGGHLHSFHRLCLFLHIIPDPFVPLSRSCAVRRPVTGCIITSRRSPFFSGGSGGGGGGRAHVARNHRLSIPFTTILPACNIDVPQGDAFLVLRIPCQDRRRQTLTKILKILSTSMHTMAQMYNNFIEDC